MSATHPWLALAFVAVTPSVLLAGGPSDSLEAELVGRQVMVEIDMPATKDGVDYFIESGRIDSRSYGERLKRHGTAIVAGEVQTITRVKVKGSHIEVQLGGGGYGTLFDETADVAVPSLAKSPREEHLAHRLDDGIDDRHELKRVKRELAELRAAREREEAWLRLEAERVAELKAVRIADRALGSGSRFNVRFDRGVPPTLTAGALKRSLQGLLVFLDDSPAVQSGVSTLGAFGPLQRGMLSDEVEARLGPASVIAERREGQLLVAEATYQGTFGPVHALFVEGVLVRLEDRRDTF